MNIIRNYATLMTTFGLMCLCSCATRDSIRPPLPADASFSQGAGRGGYLLLKLHLESGEDFNCVFDTGSSSTILGKALEPKLGKRLGTDYTFGPAGVRTNGVYLAPKLYLGKTPLLTARQVMTDEMWDDMALLGMDSLRHYCFQLDFTSNKIRFLDPDHLDTNGLGKAFPITLTDDYHVILHQNMLGVKKWVIDAGAPMDAIMSARDFGRALRGQQIMPVPATVRIKNKNSRGACIPMAEFGGNTYSNLFLEQQPQYGEDRPNMIGLNFLARNLVTFNFPKRMMYLKQVTAEPLNFGRFLTREANSFLENLVEKGQLPGRSKNNEEIGWIPETDESEAFPVSRTFKLPGETNDPNPQHRDVSVYYYTVVKETKDSPWKLQKTWQVDEDARIIKEYPVP